MFGGVKIKGRYSIEFKARYISIIIRGCTPQGMGWEVKQGGGSRVGQGRMGRGSVK